MADEPVTEQAETTTQATQAAEAVVETQETAETPHPLQPGGARFEEVYARMKQAEERAARVEGMYQQALNQQPRPPQPAYVDPNQLQALIDQGRITPMQAADILSRQNAQVAAVQTTTQAVQLQTLATKLQAAKQEVDQYISKVPALRDNSSQDFQRVSDEAYRLSDDMGLPVTDLRVQRAALRAAYGSLDKLSAAGQARQQSRTDSLPHVETRTGGGPARTASTGADPLKGVSQSYIDFWTKRGYTREQMIEEAKYVSKEPRKVTARS